MFKALIPLVIVTASVTSAMAEQVAYACKVKGKSLGYIASDLVIGLDTETGRAVVADGLIMSVQQKPIETTMSENSEKKKALKWELPLRSSSGQTIMMKYRAAIQFPSHRLIVYAAPPGYSNNFRAQGKCIVTDQKLPSLG